MVVKTEGMLQTREVTKHLTVHRTVPHNKELAQNVNNAKVVKLYFGVCSSRPFWEMYTHKCFSFFSFYLFVCVFVFKSLFILRESERMRRGGAERARERIPSRLRVSAQTSIGRGLIPTRRENMT